MLKTNGVLLAIEMVLKDSISDYTYDMADYTVDLCVPANDGNFFDLR
ncbi:hypothetical protein [Desulfosporosinus sp. HMP52]|nr:hypothetical protein [Desulfosporosinus sp. HMP52]